MVQPTAFEHGDPVVETDEFTLLRDDKLSHFPEAKPEIDPATVLGLLASLILIFTGMWLASSNGMANFFNLPSILIVVIGTITVTCISFNKTDFGDAAPYMRRVLVDKQISVAKFAYFLTDIASLTRKKGLLAMDGHAREWASHKSLAKAMQLMQDHTDPLIVARQLDEDAHVSVQSGRIAANMLRRAAEIAPGMGLLGTLIGLVQMLSQLSNPAAIGPSMAVALLTTFYGAFMSTVVLAPLAAKIERKLEQDAILHTLIKTTALSVLRHENPRYLEAALNGLLPERDRFRFFYN
ncbi:MAG: biopolymer transporter ExbB [Alphaproteobacteria bacterium]|nr:biopolymer transporter ExbB [Alphaproteobacteria bacterium]